MFESIINRYFKAPAANADAILLDDEPYVIKVWQAFASQKGLRLATFTDPHELLRSIERFQKTTNIFVDVQLKSDLHGIDVARKLVGRGYKSVYFTTSHSDGELEEVTGIKGIIDKRFPSSILVN